MQSQENQFAPTLHKLEEQQHQCEYQYQQQPYCHFRENEREIKSNTMTASTVVYGSKIQEK